MAITVVSQPVPPSAVVQQKMYSDGTNEYPAYHADNVGGGRKKTYISTATTTTVLSGGGWLKQLSAVGGTASNITVYDALTATGNPVLALVAVAANTVPAFQPIRCDVGITVVTSAALLLNVFFDADAT